MHPSAWHIAETEGRSQAAKVGHVLGHHLGVDATQAKQFDLFGTRDGVGVGHVDRGVCLEALSEAAASAATQGLAGDVLDMTGIKGSDILRLLAGGNLHLVQSQCRGHHMIVVLRLVHVVDGVVFIAYKTEHQAFIRRVKLNFIMTVLIRNGTHIGNFPIDVHAWKRCLFASFVLFVDRAFNESLGKGAGRKGHK